MARLLEGFSFSDFCLKCQKVSEHRIEMVGKEFFGVCSSCGERRIMLNPTQVHYPETELWVTKFKIGNLPSVVTGKLLDAAKNFES